MAIKPIETRYKGYRFRSRTEARYAVFFDAMMLRWEYEVEGYRLSSGQLYLPDFYLPDHQWHVEIKGYPPSFADRLKIKAFDDDPPGDSLGVILCVGQPSFDSVQHLVERVGGWWPSVNDAIDKALSARFEHGESGVSRG